MRNPFAADEHQGALGIMAGVMVLVFVAIALSLLMSGDLSLPRPSSESEHVVTDKLQSEINRLEITVHKLKRKNALADEHLKQAKLLTELDGQMKSANEETVILEKLISSKRNAIAVITEGKKRHREKYRDHVRAETLGTTYETVTTPLGKVYKDARITAITPIGVSISHRDGVARLEYGEMPREWQKRLMYTASEFTLAKRDEAKYQRQARIAIDRQVSKGNKGTNSVDPEKEIANLQRKIAVVDMKLTSARTEASLANNKVVDHRALKGTSTYSGSSYRYYNYGNGTYYYSSYRPRYRTTYIGSRSVPGSLETWEQRASRFERLSAQYEVQLKSLRLKLNSLLTRRSK